MGGCAHIGFTAWCSGSAGGGVTPNQCVPRVPSLHPHCGPTLWGQLSPNADGSRAQRDRAVPRATRTSEAVVPGGRSLRWAPGLLGSEKARGGLRQLAGSLLVWQGCLLGIMGTVLSSLNHVHSPRTGLWGAPQHPYFTDEETEAEGGTVTGAGSHMSKRQDSCDSSPHCQR